MALFLVKYDSVKSKKSMSDEDQRRLCPFQQAVRYLSFGVDTPARVGITCEFFEMMAEHVKAVDRGVLRRDVCESLKHAILFLKDQAAWAQFTQHESFSLRAAQLFKALRLLYAGISKWTSKEKHRMWALDLLVHLRCLSRDPAFLNDNGKFDVFPALLDGLKRKQDRTGCLELLTQYVTLMLDQWVTPQLGFERALAQIYAALFPRSAAPSLEETPLLRDLVVACAMKDPALVVGGWASEVLRPRAAFSVLVPMPDARCIPCSPHQPHRFHPLQAQQRAVMMQALGALGQAKPEVVDVRCGQSHHMFSPAGHGAASLLVGPISGGVSGGREVLQARGRASESRGHIGAQGRAGVFPARAPALSRTGGGGRGGGGRVVQRYRDKLLTFHRGASGWCCGATAR